MMGSQDFARTDRDLNPLVENTGESEASPMSAADPDNAIVQSPSEPYIVDYSQGGSVQDMSARSENLKHSKTTKSAAI